MNAFRHLRTTSFRLSAFYAALFLVSTGLLFSIVYWIASEVLQQQTRAILQAEMASFTEEEPPPSAADIADEIGQRLEGGKYRPVYYRLETVDGTRLAGNLPALHLAPGWHQLSYPVGQLASYPPEDENEQIVSLLGVTARLTTGEALTVAIDTYSVAEAQEAIVRAFAWAAAAGLLLALLGGFLLSRRFLHRVDEINRATLAIMNGHLDRRIPVTDSGDEIARLSINLNEMLDRLQALMEGLRQVSNDIAHDLRTPLSRLKQRLEDVQSSGTGIAEFQVATAQAIEDANDALSTFSALLRIAQIEAGTRRSQFADLDLSGLLIDLADTYRAVAEDQGTTMTVKLAPDIHVHGDRELLTQMLVNLIENALRHTPDGATLSLALHPSEDGIVIEVADNGPGIPAEERGKVFGRFYRLDQSRATPGSGLGLALVAAVVSLHQAKIELADNKPGLIVRIALPLAI